MKKTCFTLFAALLFMAASAQEKTEFVNQLERTSFLNYNYVTVDSLQADQDSIEGIYRLFERREMEEAVYYVYDAEMVWEGTHVHQLHRDFHSFGMDSMMCAPFFRVGQRNIADSLRALDFPYVGFKWNDPYFLENGLKVTFEEVNVLLDTMEGNPFYFMTYRRFLKDTSIHTTPSLYENIYTDRVFGILASFDLSGQWMGTVHNVVLDTVANEVVSQYTMEDMMTVKFVPNADSSRYELVPIEEFKQGALEDSDWATDLYVNEDTLLVAHARFTNPDWERNAGLIFQDRDTLSYFIRVDPTAIEAMGSDPLPDHQIFVWHWEYARLPEGTKE